MTDYTPGVCNIGPAERRKRYGLAAAGFGIAVVIGAVIQGLGWPSPLLLVIAAPLALGFEGLYQGWYGFCAGFALQGIYDVSDDGSERHDVDDQTAHRKDMAKAREIHVYAIVSAGAAAGTVYLVGSAL